jgi:hypothetical protein
MSNEQKLTSIGFKFGRNGAHSARSMMIEELKKLLFARDETATKQDYEDDIVNFNKTIQRHSFLAISMLFSSLILGFFLHLQSKDSKILELDAQWVAISILPVLVALVIGGYISKFKGFGIELESKLEAPVNSIQLTATDAFDELPTNEKESLGDLNQVSETQKREAKRLSFNMDKKGYYVTHAIEEYINNLPNIEYLEVKRENGVFICLLPISLFKTGSEQNMNVRTNYDAINKFRTAIDEGSVVSVFSNAAITLTVQSSKSLLEVLRTLRFNDSGIAGVISKENKLVGVITATLVEKRIADEVLGTKA